MPVLNGYAPADATYDPAGTLNNMTPCAKVTLDVTNALIFWQIRQAVETGAFPGQSGQYGGDWTSEVQMLPGSKTITRPNIIGVRVRAAVAGAGAIITIDAVPNELSG